MPPSPRRPRAVRTAMAVTTAAVLALSASACGGAADSGSASGQLSLTAWNGVPYEPFTSVNRKQLKTCAAANGAKIKSETLPADQLVPRVLQSASSRSLPDLLLLDSADVARVAEAGVLTDLGDYGITGEGFDKKALSLGRGKDGLYGLTPSVNTIALFYNKAMFKEAGLKPPKTFAELRSAARELTTPDRYGIALPGDSKGTGAYVFLPFVLSAGGDPKTVTDEGTRTALELWKGLADDGSMSKDMVNWGWDAPDQFIGGKAAMTVSGPWTVGNLKGKGIDFGIVPMPTAGTDAAVSPIGGETWTVPVTDGARQKVAAKIVECVSDKANELEQARTGLRIPARVDAAEQYKAEEPRVAAFVDQIPAAYNRNEQLGEAWNKRTTQYGAALQYALVGGDTPEQALRKASAE